MKTVDMGRGNMRGVRFSKGLLPIVIATTFFISGCGSGTTPEEARMKLGQMDIDYSIENFVKTAASGDLVTIKLFIQAGIDINATGNNDWTALMAAANNGHIETVTTLIKAGANVNAKDEGSWTALMFAANNGHKKIVSVLINAGADVHDVPVPAPPRKQDMKVLPRSILGFQLGYNITEVDQIAAELKVVDYSESMGYPPSKDFRIYSMKYSNPTFLMITVSLTEGKVTEVKGSYQSKVGKYEDIVEKAKDKFGDSFEVKPLKLGTRWYFETSWMDNDTLVSITKSAETKKSHGSVELYLRDKDAYFKKMRQISKHNKEMKKKTESEMLGQ